MARLLVIIIIFSIALLSMVPSTGGEMARSFTIPDLLDEKGRAVSNATCKAFRIDTHAWVETQTTDADGAATFTALPEAVDCVVIAFWGKKSALISAPDRSLTNLEAGTLSVSGGNVIIDSVGLTLDSQGEAVIWFDNGGEDINTFGKILVNSEGYLVITSPSILVDAGPPKVYNYLGVKIPVLLLNHPFPETVGASWIGLASTDQYFYSLATMMVTLSETTTPTAIADYGQIYTKSDNKFYFQDGAGTEKTVLSTENIITKYKSSDETVNNSIAMQNDDDLYFAVAANERWEATWTLYLTQGNSATPEFDYRIDDPAQAATIFSDTHSLSIGASGVSVSAASPTEITIDTGANDVGLIVIHALVIAGASSGTVYLQWAQNAATAVDTTVKAGSCMIAHKLA